MNEASEEYKQLDIEMLIASAPAPAPMTNMKKQAVMPKSMILDLEWFAGD